MKRQVSLTIPPGTADVQLLSFLTRRFTYHDQNSWKNLINAGRVRVNSHKAYSDQILHPGDTVAYVQFNRTEPSIRRDYSILFEDETLLVINKPGNLPCHPGGRYFNHSLWGLLQTDYPGSSFFFVNRIDRETSGIVLLAKTSAAARYCQKQFNEGTVRKNYWVIIEGDFPSSEIFADGFLEPDEGSPVRKKKRFLDRRYGGACSKSAKPCKTKFKLIQKGEGRSLVCAEPLSGRLHQIRATLCSLGYPVTGDKIYGVDDTLFLRFIEDRLTASDLHKLCLRRQALHARFLEMTHPVSGERIHFSAQLPEDMANFFPYGK